MLWEDLQTSSGKTYRPNLGRLTGSYREALRRARIVSEPASEYIKFEYEVTPTANLAAGEQVRWLSRQKASDLALPGNDFWLFDDAAVLFNHFGGDGTAVGSELRTEPSVMFDLGARAHGPDAAAAAGRLVKDMRAWLDAGSPGRYCTSCPQALPTATCPPGRRWTSATAATSSPSPLRNPRWRQLVRRGGSS